MQNISSTVEREIEISRQKILYLEKKNQSNSNHSRKKKKNEKICFNLLDLSENNILNTIFFLNENINEKQFCSQFQDYRLKMRISMNFCASNLYDEFFIWHIIKCCTL